MRRANHGTGFGPGLLQPVVSRARDSVGLKESLFLFFICLPPSPIIGAFRSCGWCCVVRHRAHACTTDRRISHASGRQATTGCGRHSAAWASSLTPPEFESTSRNAKSASFTTYAVVQLPYHASSQCLLFDRMNHGESATVSPKARPIC